MRSSFRFLLIGSLLIGCSAVPMKRIYAYSHAKPRPEFVADPSKKVEWIEVAESSAVTIGDGPGLRSSMTYPQGGTVGFDSGGQEHFDYIELRFDGSGFVVVETTKRAEPK